MRFISYYNLGWIMKISIIIPVYNVSGYIERCWASVNAQTYSDIELIFVDDCGTDDSMAKLESCVAGGSRFPVKIIRHERNRGLSAARNTGVDASTGDYLYFLDSDDDILPDCITNLVSPLGQFEYDFVIGGYNLVGDGGCSPLTLQEGGFFNNEDIIRSYAEGRWYVMAWNKLIKKSFVLEKELYFKEGLIHEDVLWSFRLACLAKSMYVIPTGVYNYYVRKASIMTSLSIEKDLSIYLDVFDEICMFVKYTGRVEGHWEYELIEGKKCGIMYSLLQLKEYGLFKFAYHRFRRQFYLSPVRAFRIGTIGFGKFIRDLHYILPEHLGRCYKRMFFVISYKLFGRKLRGLVWNK